MSRNIAFGSGSAWRMSCNTFVITVRSSSLKLSTACGEGRLLNIDLRNGNLLTKAVVQRWSKSMLNSSEIALRYLSVVGISWPDLQRVIAPGLTPASFAASWPLSSLERIAESKVRAKEFGVCFLMAFLLFVVFSSRIISNGNGLSREKWRSIEKIITKTFLTNKVKCASL